MTDNTQRSLGELRKSYTRQIQEWSERKKEHEKKARECQQEIEAFELKLSYVEALIGGSPAAERAPVAEPPRRRLRSRPQRQSPVKMATLLALRNRPDELLTTQQILDAILVDTGKQVSRQSVNVNLGLLEEEGRLIKQPAPREAGARFVYTAAP